MRYITLILMFLSFSAAYFIARANQRTSRQNTQDTQNFWNRESESNFVRRADISNLDYLKPNLDSLPLDAAKNLGLTDIIDKLEKLSHKKIINLSQYTNTDLKMMYGPANLDSLSEYDSNYIVLIRTLNTLGDAMYEKGDSQNAKCVYEYAISIGSDISNTYIMLGTIYHETNDTAALDLLLDKADKLTSLSACSIATKLNNIKSGAK